jgi:3'(2'), 5'-bisphosphate nucleotidase
VTHPINPETRNALAARFGDIASAAGRVIMAFYASDCVVKTKADGSPVSEADTAAEQIISDGLRKVLPGVPMLAEETFDAAAFREAPETFLLVDPLDGTREFVSRNGEFTVNIALIQSGVPVVGCVYVPALDQIYLGGEGAFRAAVKPGEPLPALDTMESLTTRAYSEAGLRAAISRSHLDPQTEALLRRLPIASRLSAGSALKFCVMARGDADVYPRFSRTMEWDVAAGHAVLSAAGGCVLAADGAPLRYGKVDTGFCNESFVAWGRGPVQLK